MAQLQHNMWVTHLRAAVLSIITGGGKWVGDQEFAALFRDTRDAFLDHERAKSELKALMPEVWAWRESKTLKIGAMSFDVPETAATHAPIQ